MCSVVGKEDSFSTGNIRRWCGTCLVKDEPMLMYSFKNAYLFKDANLFLPFTKSYFQVTLYLFLYLSPACSQCKWAQALEKNLLSKSQMCLHVDTVGSACPGMLVVHWLYLPFTSQLEKKEVVSSIPQYFLFLKYLFCLVFYFCLFSYS